jgi:acyl dehydratase
MQTVIVDGTDLEAVKSLKGDFGDYGSPFMVTEEAVNEHADRTGDRNPLHLDEGMARFGPFGRDKVLGSSRVAHGALISEKLIMMRPPQRWDLTSVESPIRRKDVYEYVGPAYIGDILHTREKVAAAKVVPGEGIHVMISFEVAVKGDNRIVMTGSTFLFYEYKKPVAAEAA